MSNIIGNDSVEAQTHFKKVVMDAAMRRRQFKLTQAKM